MKNFIYILIIISLVSPMAVFAQEDKVAPDLSNEVTKGSSKAVTPAAPKEVIPPASEGTVKSTPSKPLFGSQEHKDSIGLVGDKKEETENLMVKTCLALAAVIGLILLIFYSLKKINRRLYSNGKTNPLRISSRLPLDGKNYLTLVRIYEEEFLLSVGPNGTTVVARYALIDQEEGDTPPSPLSDDKKKPFVIDQETHITSINLKPIKDQDDEDR